MEGNAPRRVMSRMALLRFSTLAIYSQSGYTVLELGGVG